MTNKKLIKMLDEWGIDYEVLKHKTVFTAHDVAATLRTKLDDIVKTLIIEADKRFYLVSLPATKNVDFKRLAKAIKKMGGSVKTIAIPNEKVLAKKLGIKPGSVTAFAKLHDLPHIVDKDIKKIKKAVLSGGSVSESIKMKMADWLKVEEPKVEIIGVKRKVKTQKSKLKGKTKKLKGSSKGRSASGGKKSQPKAGNRPKAGKKKTIKVKKVKKVAKKKVVKKRR